MLFSSTANGRNRRKNRKLSVISPVTEQVVMTFAEGSPRDVDRAVAAAREAFDEGPWPRMSPQERGAALLKVAENLKARLPELAQAWTTQVGAPISFTTLCVRAIAGAVRVLRHADPVVPPRR